MCVCASSLEEEEAIHHLLIIDLDFAASAKYSTLAFSLPHDGPENSGLTVRSRFGQVQIVSK